MEFNICLVHSHRIQTRKVKDDIYRERPSLYAKTSRTSRFIVMGCGASSPVVPVNETTIPPFVAEGANEDNVLFPNGMQIKSVSNGVIPLKAPLPFRLPTALRNNAVAPASISASSLLHHHGSSSVSDEVSDVRDVYSIKRVTHNRHQSQLSNISETPFEESLIEYSSIAVQTDLFDLSSGVKYQYVQTDDLEFLPEDELEEMLASIDDDDDNLVEVTDYSLFVSPSTPKCDENQNQVDIKDSSGDFHQHASTQTVRNHLVSRSALTKLSIRNPLFSRRVSSIRSPLMSRDHVPHHHDAIAKTLSVASYDFMTFSSERGDPLTFSNDDEESSGKKDLDDSFPKSEAKISEEVRPPSLTSSIQEFSQLEQDIEKSSVKAVLSGSSAGRFLNEFNQVLGDLTEDSKASLRRFNSKENIGSGKFFCSCSEMCVQKFSSHCAE
jgi:hypothetical protein